MEKICGIYKITNPNGMIYIGRSLNCNVRYSQYKRGECKTQPRLYNSIKKYGWDTHKFEVIHQCSELELNILEKHYSELHQSINPNHGLNIRECGEHAYHSKETKIKIGISNKGKPRSAETRFKLRMANLGKKHSSETRLKMSELRKGNPKFYEKMLKSPRSKMSDTQKKVISKRFTGNKYFLGRKHTLETRLKMSEIGKKRQYSKETRNKMSLAKKGKPWTIARRISTSKSK